MWTITFGDRSMSLDDLKPETFEQIADKYELSWLDLYYGPAQNMSAYYELLVACATHCGAPAPDAPKTLGEAKAQLDLIEKTDGANVDPQEPSESDPTTTLSTGSSPGSDGLPPSPEASES